MSIKAILCRWLFEATLTFEAAALSLRRTYAFCVVFVAYLGSGRL